MFSKARTRHRSSFSSSCLRETRRGRGKRGAIVGNAARRGAAAAPGRRRGGWRCRPPTPRVSGSPRRSSGPPCRCRACARESTAHAQSCEPVKQRVESVLYSRLSMLINNPSCTHASRSSVRWRRATRRCSTRWTLGSAAPRCTGPRRRTGCRRCAARVRTRARFRNRGAAS